MNRHPNVERRAGRRWDGGVRSRRKVPFGKSKSVARVVGVDYPARGSKVEPLGEPRANPYPANLIPLSAISVNIIDAVDSAGCHVAPLAGLARIPAVRIAGFIGN